MFALSLHNDAKADLLKIKGENLESFTRIVTILEQIKNDPAMLKHLLEHDFGPEGGAPFNVSKWQELWRKGYDVWRIKVWDVRDKLLPYRIIYAYDYSGREQRFHILGVVPRGFKYDTNHPDSKRIIAAYRDLT